MHCTADQANRILEAQVSKIADEILEMPKAQITGDLWNEDNKKLEEMLSKYCPSIMTSGNIGFGKTTVAKIIGAFGHARVHQENTENPVLQKYYTDMASYSIPLQINLMDTRLMDMVLNKISPIKEPWAYDRSHYEDLMFTEVLYKNGLMKKKGRDFCFWYFPMKKEELEKRFGVSLTPDLMIFVNGNIKRGWQRVKERKRVMEMRKDARKGVGLSYEFYKTLQAEYDRFPGLLQEYYKGVCITIPQTKIEISDVSNDKGQLYVVRSVIEGLKAVYGQ